ncbi:hypothetical protein CHS0354_020513 [Potamilus streckersoni]|uniref:Uncharacterized protein n=1 Tax=Potamilus streckersoni TaxID=2493646 RepID=A0AAE0SHU6_9BIVA|nr:hypothetical protein CHS0354_020513 [Potamilus streckersoni]
MAASALARGMLILFFAALVLFAIGFSTAYWQKFEIGLLNVHWGLWRSCVGDICKDNSLPDASSDISWFEATQAFETLGFIAALAALVLIVLYIFVPQTSGKRIICILSMLACFAAAGCIMLGIIIYGSKVERNLSWSFALCCIAGIIFGVSGVLLLIDMVKK